jgi:hypothetical protein
MTWALWMPCCPIAGSKLILSTSKTSCGNRLRVLRVVAPQSSPKNVAVPDHRPVTIKGPLPRPVELKHGPFVTEVAGTISTVF